MTQNASKPIITTGDNNAIYAVTVFANQAYVKRRVTVLAETGFNRFLIEINAFAIDTDSVQADVYGSGEIISVQYKEVPVLDTDIKQVDINALKTEQRQLENRLKELEYGLKNCLKQRTFLDLATNPNGKQGAEDAAIAPRSAQDLKEMLQNLKEMLGHVSINYAETFTQELEIVHEQQQINEQLTLITSKLKYTPNIRSPSTYKTIEVLFNSNSNEEVKIDLAYIVKYALWKPFYKVDVNRELSNIHITMFAHIEQNTGEDWQGVNLSVSNAISINGGKLPELNSWFITPANTQDTSTTENSFSFEFSPYPYENATQDCLLREIYEVDPIAKADVYITSGRYQQAETLLRQVLEQQPNRTDLQAKLIEVFLATQQISAEEAQTKLAQLKAPTPAKFAQAQQIASDISFECQLPATNDIPSGDGEHLLPLFSKETPHQFFYYAIPKQDAQVYLVCQANVDSTLLPGRLNIHIAGRFIGHTLLDEKQAGRELLINLGAVRDVKILRECIVNQVSERMLQGLIERRDIVRNIELRIAIENLQDKEIFIKVIDALPIAVTDRIQVKDMVTIPEPTIKDIQHKQGVMQWDMNISAKQTKDMRIKFTLKYPKDQESHIEKANKELRISSTTQLNLLKR